MIKDPSPRVASCILKSVGELAKVAGRDVEPYMGRLLPLIVDSIQDQSSDAKREAGYHTLGLLIFHSGHVVTVLRVPRLFDCIVSAVNNEKCATIRHEVCLFSKSISIHRTSHLIADFSIGGKTPRPYRGR